jgi:hypothetical protein
MPRLYQRLIAGVASHKLLGDCIIEQIKAAQAFRQVEHVKELARVLINIPIREYNLIAQYYLVWCNCRELKYDNEALEKIIDQTKTYKVKALSSRGTFEWYKGNNENALYFYNEALRASPKISEYIEISKSIAVLKGQEGFHKKALDDLENLLPMIRYAKPYVYFDIMNSYAVELAEVGRIEEAAHASSIALASPFAPAYPEWRETHDGITLETCRASRSTVAVGSWHDERESIRAVGNLVSLPTVERDKTCDNTKQDKQENARILIFTPKVADKTQPDSACIPIESKPMECDEGSDTEYTVNYSPVRTLTLRFVNTKGQERLKLEIRHDPDGAVADIWVRDKEGNSHSFFSACFLD